MNVAVMPNSATETDFAIGTSDRPQGLPDNWSYVPLRSVCEKTSIWNPVREPRDHFHYIDVSAVSNEHFCVTGTQEIAGPSAPSRARKIVKAGDVIYATVRPSLKRVAWIEPHYDDQIASTAFCIVRADPKQAVSKFLYYVLLSDDVNRKIIEHERGASYPAVTDKDVLNQFVPLPPIDEQEKIAAVLCKIQKAVEIEDAIVRNARDLKKSLLCRVFTHGLRGEPLKETEIGPLAKNWEVRNLASVASLERGRFLHRPRNEPRFYGGNTPFVQTGDVVRSNGRVRNYSQTLNEEGVKISRIFPAGTILITIAANIGYSGILEFDSACPDSLIGITPRELIEGEYLLYYLQTQQSRMDTLAPRGTQKNINIQFLSPWPVAFPPKDEQREIADTLQTVDRKIDIHESKKRSLQELFKTTLHKLMTAQIRVKDLEIDTSEVSQ
jgi:type I restriction enzyme S subunit